MATTDYKDKYIQVMVGLPTLVATSFYEKKYLPLFLSCVHMVLPQHSYSDKVQFSRGYLSRIPNDFCRQGFVEEIICLRGSICSLLPIG